MESRRQNDCVIIALASHFAKTYEEVEAECRARSDAWRRNDGVEWRVVMDLVEEWTGLTYLDWQKRQTSASGLWRCHRNGVYHLASVVDSRVLLEDGTRKHIALVEVTGWKTRHWLPVAPVNSLEPLQ